MRKIKRILSFIVIIAIMAVAAFMLFNGSIEHIEDTNGADNYSLQTITDENIINMDLGARNYSQRVAKNKSSGKFSSDKFTGVAEVWSSNYISSPLEITINHNSVTSGNFKLVLVIDDEIVHEFTLNELSQTYELESVTGYVALCMAGESADFMFDYSIG